MRPRPMSPATETRAPALGPLSVLGLRFRVYKFRDCVFRDSGLGFREFFVFLKRLFSNSPGLGSRVLRGEGWGGGGRGQGSGIWI